MRMKIDSQEKRLDDLFRIVENISDEETQSLLSKFLCVRTSGFIETTIKNLINEFISGSSPKPVQEFVNKKMKNVTNLKYEKMLELLSAFSSKWANQLSLKITDEEKAALNSIVSNRNNIAHGENDSISFEIMKEYYIHAKDVVNILKSIIKK